MSGKRRRLLAYGCLLAAGMWATLMMVSPAYADSTPTPPAGWSGSYQVVSPDGRYVLVMLRSIDCSPCYFDSSWVGERNRLLCRYSQSGPYRNDGSVRPLWTMGYVSWRKDVTLASDGHHLVVWGEWPTRNLEYANEALTFYEDGHPLVRYDVRDLVTDPETLPHSVSHFEWLEDRDLDHTNNILSLQTLNGELYTFNMATGMQLSWARVVPTIEVLQTKTQPTFS